MARQNDILWTVIDCHFSWRDCFTCLADQAYIFIRPENETEDRAVRLTSATAVQPGDTVRIPDRMSNRCY